MELRFRDHASFHRAALGMTAGSALFGFAAAVFGPHMSVTMTAPIVGGVLGIGTGAAFAYGARAWRISAAMCAAAIIVIAGSGAIGAVPAWQALVASSLAVGISIAIGQRGVRAVGSMLVGMAVAMLAMWTALRVTHAQRTETWSLIGRDVVAAGAMGIVGVLAMLPRHLELISDPVRMAVQRLPAELDSEVRSLCGRAVEIWNATKDKHGDSGANVALVRDGVLKALEVAAKSTAIGAQRTAGTTDDELARRIAELDTRVAAATDAEIESQYRAARSALADQQRYRDGIRKNRERLVARLHNHVAALEKFQLAAGGMANASELTSSVEASSAALGDDVASAS
ncbi:MAG TPA: hypothetical protein VH143_33565 [Kofleriaceae bacterium]|nr:hypothetical protein [Kofleriaceae bacterium]